MSIENIISVDLNLEKVKYKPEYQVIIDRPIEYVIQTARSNEPNNVFTCPFYTGSVEDAPDFSTICVVEYGHKNMTDDQVDEHNENCLSVVEGLYHLMMPYYVGDFDEPCKAIKDICEMYFKEDT